MGLFNIIFNKIYSYRTRYIGDALLPFIEKNCSLLDFGCSTMAVTRYIAPKKNIKLFGIDVDKYDIKDAEFIHYKGGKLPFKDNEFDIVMSIFVLHHTDNPDFYLDEIIRVAKKKIIICEDTYKNKIEEMFTKGADWIFNYLYLDEIALNFKSVDEWKKLINQRNVKIKSFTRFHPYVLPFIPIRNVIFEIEKDH